MREPHSQSSTLPSIGALNRAYARAEQADDRERAAERLREAMRQIGQAGCTVAELDAAMRAVRASGLSMPGVRVTKRG